MKCIIKRNEQAKICIVEIIGKHNVPGLENRLDFYSEHISIPFHYMALLVDDWNIDLSPWKALDFGDGAQNTYIELMKNLQEIEAKEYYLAGYSLAGLFCLWVGYQTAFFSGIVACSPSVWFPEWDAFMESHTFLTKRVYLSLGTKEHKTKHPYMREVKKKIQLAQNLLQCHLEMNPGNHFQNVNERMMKGLQYILKEGAE